MAGTCCARYFCDCFVHERMPPAGCRAAALGCWLATMAAAPANAPGVMRLPRNTSRFFMRSQNRVGGSALHLGLCLARQTKLGRVAESLRLTGKGFIKCFSTLSFFSQVAYSSSPLQRRSPPNAKTYVRSSIWSQRLRCHFRNRCHETVRRRSASGWSATQPQRDASVLQSDAGAMSISRRRAIEPRC